MALEDELREAVQAAEESMNRGVMSYVTDGRKTFEGLAWANRQAILAALTERKAPVEVEGSENKAGGLWYRRWFKAQVLNNELTARIAELEAENFTLAAGQCTVENGLIGDEHGHFACSLKQQLAEREEALREAADILDRYAAFVSQVPADDLELHPYQPAIADAAERARHLTRTDGGDQ